MPQSDVPSAFFFKNGHLKTSSQQAPQRLHSPCRSASEAIISCLRNFVLTNRRILPCAWRARSFASETCRERRRRAIRSSNERCLTSATLRRVFIKRSCDYRNLLEQYDCACNRKGKELAPSEKVRANESTNLMSTLLNRSPPANETVLEN